MSYRVLDAERPQDLSAWLALWQAWPRREVMAHPEYVRLFARPGDRVVAAVAEDAGGATLFPLVLRPLATEPWAAPGEDRWDAISPYGYGGPFAWGDGPRDHAGFWAAHERFCRESRVVSTFVRLSLFAPELAPFPGGVEPRGPCIVRDLRPGMDAIWKDYDHQVRTNVRNAQKKGLRVDVDRTAAGLDAFLPIYADTMDRRGAAAFYRFPRPFFTRLCEGLAGQFAFVSASYQGEPVCSELVLVSATRIYAFLGGTRADAFPLRPNDLVRHAQVVWGLEEGKDELVLGGGYAPNDGIFRHKRNLAPTGEVPFHVAAMVHDGDAYAALVHQRSLASPPPDAREGFFPAYRA